MFDNDYLFLFFSFSFQLCSDATDVLYLILALLF